MGRRLTAPLRYAQAITSWLRLNDRMLTVLGLGYGFPGRVTCQNSQPCVAASLTTYGFHNERQDSALVSQKKRVKDGRSGCSLEERNQI